jgi:NitT/TauT family transport system permease protein
MAETIEVARPTTTEPTTPFHRTDAFVQIGIAVATLGLWEFVSRALKLDFWISSPISVVKEFGTWVASGQLTTDLRLTLTEVGAGFLIGSTIGGLTGFVLGWVRRLGDLFEPFILSLYTLPKVALAPLFALRFGIGVINNVMFSAMLVFFMVFFTTYQGTRQVDRDVVENARLLGAGRWDIWTKIVIPYAAVWVLTGIRIGLPYALIGAIVGVFVASEAGVSYRINEATSYFNTAAVFSGLIVLMAISLSLLMILNVIEKHTWMADGQGVIWPEDAA